MKISKVNHVRTGVKVNDFSGEGIIYENPSKRDCAEKSLEKHIYQVTLKARGLYSPITSVDSLKKSAKGRSEKEAIDNANKAFTSVVVEIVKENESGIPQADKLIGIIKQKASNCFTYQGDAKALANRLVSKCLRKKLVVKDNIAKDLLAAIISKEKESTIEELDLSEIKEFFELVHKDYFKKEQIKEIEKSIKNKDVKVQVKEGKEKELVLSSADSEKKHFYYDFLNDYSGLDYSGRMNMIIRIRQLIILFYSGEKSYNLSLNSDVGAWTFGSLLPEASENWDDEVYKLITEMDTNISQKDKLSALIEKDKRALAEMREKDEMNSSEFRQTDQKLKDRKIELFSLDYIIRAEKKDIKNKLDKILCDNYRLAIKADCLSESDIFWIGYIQGVAQKQFDKKEAYTTFRISTKYLYEVTFNEWVSFVALKYIDMGKAVYHFAIPNLDNLESGEELRIGRVQPKFENGITSFDYERIKAKETITRAYAVKAMYAAGVFSNAVTKPEIRLMETYEDPMFYSDSDWNEALVNNAKMKVLMYFGGQSRWSGTAINNYGDVEFVKAFQQHIKAIRNYNFHYAGSFKVKEDSNIAQDLFNFEFDDVGRQVREKYLSNNVPVFYKTEDINRMMSYLYKDESVSEAQIPSFSKIFKKKDISGFAEKFISGSNRAKYNVETIEKLRAALYFVLKDAYYYGFLKEKNLKERFLESLESASSAKNEKALDNFKERINGLDNSLTFGEICQILMTDYNQQNSNEYKIKPQSVQNKEEKNGHKYAHFKMILYVSLQDAFIKYINEKDVFAFLKEPVYRQNYFDTDDANTFTTDWKTEIFKEVKDAILKDQYCLSWYIVAHFLPSKQLNHLQGEIKSYIQFAKDINRREKSVFGFVKDNTLVDNIDIYNRVLSVIKFVSFFAGKVSNDLTDYFHDEDDYALFLSNFVKFAAKKEEKSNATLSAFCNKKIEKRGIIFTDRIGIYHDGTNPILNSNIIKALMFGNVKILSESVEPISGDLMNGELFKYYELKGNLKNVFEKGKTQNIEEERAKVDFQNKKNRIELHDVAVLTDILNDYMSELVNMAFLRERDLMYYQLGFNYFRLKNLNMDSKFNTIKTDKVNIETGALLYQIISLYSFDLPTFYIKNERYAVATGRKINYFVEKYCLEEMDGEETTYNCGLEFFEDRKCHDYFVKFRNEIDHQKFFAKAEKSILDMYSDAYNGFFSYDIKLKKSVSYVFSNILADYFVIAETKIKPTVKDLRINFSEDELGVRKGVRYAKLSLNSVKSDSYTYIYVKKDKFGKDKEKKDFIPARSDEFLNGVKRLVSYKVV